MRGDLASVCGEQQGTKNSSTPLISLTPEEVRHLPRPLSGFAEWVEPVIEMYLANEDALRIDGLDVTAIRESLAAWQALKAPIREAAAKLAVLEESALYYASNAWSGILEIYARAVVVGRVNKDVANAIIAFARFMKKPRKKKNVVAPVTP